MIGGFISDQRKRNRDGILLVGDFNVIPGQDVSNFHHLGGDDVMDFVISCRHGIFQTANSHILEKGRANLLPHPD